MYKVGQEQNSTETIEQKIVKIFEAKANRKKYFEDVLGDLYQKLEPIFSKKEIFGNCGECAGCLNKGNNEYGIFVGNLAFSNGGHCYKGRVGQFDDERILNEVAFLSEGKWKMNDSADYSLLRINLNAEMLKNSLDKKIKNISQI